MYVCVWLYLFSACLSSEGFRTDCQHVYSRVCAFSLFSEYEFFSRLFYYLNPIYIFTYFQTKHLNCSRMYKQNSC